MTHTVRKLNDTRHHLDGVNEKCKQKMIALESEDKELIGQNIKLLNKYHILLLDHQKTQKQKQLLKQLFNHIRAG